jgi:hypothetical protein
MIQNSKSSDEAVESPRCPAMCLGGTVFDATCINMHLNDQRENATTHPPKKITLRPHVLDESAGNSQELNCAYNQPS